jgi:hypothetical protein
MNSRVKVAVLLFTVIPELGACGYSWSQTTVAAGSIAGTVTDPLDAIVVRALVRITDVDTQQVILLVTNSSRSFKSGSLRPGKYELHVAFSRFEPVNTQLIDVFSNAEIKFENRSTVRAASKDDHRQCNLCPERDELRQGELS